MSDAAGPSNQVLKPLVRGKKGRGKGKGGSGGNTRRKGKGRMDEAQVARALEALEEEIEAQAQVMRDRKADGVSRFDLEAEIFALLALKYRHPKHRHLCYRFDATEFPPKVIKIRWVFRDPKTGARVQMQMPYRDVTEVSAAEVIEVIEGRMKAKYPHVGGILKLEQRVPIVDVPLLTDKKNAGSGAGASEPGSEPGAAAAVEEDNGGANVSSAIDEAAEAAAAAAMASMTRADRVRALSKKSHAYVAVRPDDVFRLPLVTPGPRLKNVHTVQLRVTLADADAAEAVPPRMVDAGLNLYDGKFKRDLETVVRRAFSSGVSDMVLLSTNLESCKKSLRIALQHAGSLHVALGVHPTDASRAGPFDQDAFDKLAQFIRHARTNPLTRDSVVAMGEIGLDYTWRAAAKSKKAALAAGTAADAGAADAPQTFAINEEARASQLAWAEAQLAFAAAEGLPVVFHEREASQDALALLAKYRSQLSGVAINCFSGDAESLKGYVDLGCHIVFTGLVANKDRGAHLPELVASVPGELLLIATDAPFMMPFNKPKPWPTRNEPAFLPYVAAAVADARASTVPEVAQLARANALALFGIRDSYSAKRDTGAPAPLSEVQPKTPTASAHVSAAAFALSDSERLFEHSGTLYKVSKKEQAILLKQRDALDAAAFDQLVVDFELERVGTVE